MMREAVIETGKAERRAPPPCASFGPEVAGSIPANDTKFDVRP